MKKTLVPALIQKAIRNEAGERYDVSDAAQRGLVLRVSPGVATWTFRFKRESKSVRLTIGAAHSMDLSTARRIVQAGQDALAAGRLPDESWMRDRLVELGLREAPPPPPASVKPQPAAAETWTYAEAVSAYIDGIRPRPRPQTEIDYRNILMGPHLRHLADRPLTDISRREIAVLIRDVYDSGIEASAHRIARQLGMMWGFAAGDAFQALSGLTVNTMKELPVPRRGDDSVRHTRSPEIAAMARLVAICRTDVFHPRIATALELAVLTAQRRMTIVSTLVRDVQRYRGAMIWSIGSEAMKGKLEHVLPTTDRIAALLKQQVRDAGESPFLFPQIKARRAGAAMTHLSQHTLTGRLIDLPGCEFTPHDIRRSFTDLMEELEENRAELILDHREGRRSTKDKRYNKYKYLMKKKQMLSAWGDAIEDAVQVVEIDPDEVKAGLRAAYKHRNRNRVVRKKPVIDPGAVAIGSGAEDDFMTLEDIVEEWSTGHLHDDDALALAKLRAVSDLVVLAENFGFATRR